MATKTTTPAAEFKNIALKDIEADINQPRKFFDEHSLAELASSVKANGVLQPIMVRPKGKKYLLVYGERRFKAALVIGLKEIPAIVRELSDSQALDIQITENLQRKDVHPMEEAVAFKKLLESFTIEDIALRIGKSESFVAKRIQLTELVEDAQQVFFLNKISISDAVKLARLDKEVQQEIMKEALPEDWKENEDFRLGRYGRGIGSYIQEQQFDLSKAIFKLNEKMLYKEAGACVGCKFNSASTPLLFEEEEGKQNICSKPACFQIKTQRQEKKNLERFATDPTKIVILTKSKNYLDDESKSKVALAEEMGINVITKDCFEEVEEPRDIMNYKEWLEDYYWEDADEDEDTTEEDKLQYKQEYEEYLVELNKEKIEYKEIIDSGKAILATDILTQKSILVIIKDNAKREVEQSTGNAGNDATKEEIEKIESREARARELDAEKVWEKVRELLSNKENQQAMYVFADLSNNELQAFGTALYSQLGYNEKKVAIKMLCMDDIDTYEFALTDINALGRIFIIDKLVNSFGSHISNKHNQLAYEVIKQYLPTEIGKIELEQQELAEARGERVAKKIKVLKDKLILN